ncbi:LysR family transcriptional regulator [Halopseudomonas pelagia]|uniref:LysR family transcriptional regulator n=1 Tax=Halopseudomonas pelagia TaxID=553151 RepID=UPI0030D6DEE1|tara:strand:+ start:63 stop:992 length:930 start_codon:yes stop_codon:yes gene_type:complete
MSLPPLPAGLTQLLWFVRVVEAGSFAEAARRAGTSTSALSKAVSRFERTYGVRLLHRTTHSLSLTDEGDRLLSEGRSLLNDLERSENLLADLGNSGVSGRVRLAAPTAFARTCLMPALPKFLSEHPEIDIELQFGDDIPDMAARGLDLAIRVEGPANWPGCISRKLFTFPWILCASPEYLCAKGKPLTPSDLAEHTQIGFRNRATGQIDSWNFKSPTDQKEIRYIPKPKYVFDDGESAWSMVRDGFGVAWAPRWLGLEDLRSGRVVEVMANWRTKESPLFAIRLQRRLTPKRTQLVLDFIASLTCEWQR